VKIENRGGWMEILWFNETTDGNLIHGRHRSRGFSVEMLSVNSPLTRGGGGDKVNKKQRTFVESTTNSKSERTVKKGKPSQKNGYKRCQIYGGKRQGAADTFPQHRCWFNLGKGAVDCHRRKLAVGKVEERGPFLEALILSEKIHEPKTKGGMI